MKKIIYRVFEKSSRENPGIEIEEAEIVRETEKRYYTEGCPRAFNYCQFVDKWQTWIDFSKKDALMYFIRAKEAEIAGLEREKKRIEMLIDMAEGMIGIVEER